MSGAILVLAAMGMGISLLLSLFFSGSETAVISVRKYHLRAKVKEGDARAERTLEFLDNTPRVLSTVLIGNNFANVLIVLFFKLIIDTGFPDFAHSNAVGSIQWNEMISLIALTPLIVVFAEILPKAVFRAKADQWIHSLRPVLVGAMTLFAPAIAALDSLLRVVLAVFRIEGSGTGRRLTRSDVIMMLNGPLPEDAQGGDSPPAAGGENGNGGNGAPPAEGPAHLREPDERVLIRNIIQLDRTLVLEIMRPLVDLHAIHLGQATRETAISLAKTTGHTRFPVYRDRIVNFEGYINIYDLIRDAEPGRPLESYVRPAHYVPETKDADELLQEFLDRRIDAAIVVDEFGGCTGWVTREDILEEIVGELEDELDRPWSQIEEDGSGAYRIGGRTEVCDVDEMLGTNLEEPHCETLAGVVLKALGRIPAEGDNVVIQGWRMRVERMQGRRIDLLRVERAAEPDAVGKQEG